MKKTQSIQSQFGLRVKELRKNQGLSQEAFADKCGLDRTYISGIERGVRNPSLEIISILAKGFDMSLKELFDSDEIF